MKVAAVILQASPLKRAAALKWKRDFPISIKAVCKKTLVNTVNTVVCTNYKLRTVQTSSSTFTKKISWQSI